MDSQLNDQEDAAMSQQCSSAKPPPVDLQEGRFALPMATLSIPQDSASENVSSDAQRAQSTHASVPPLKRPRKAVYKSTLRKRDREKKRRDNFNQGLERLAELVFQIDPSISSGRDDHIVNHGISTTITNRGELMQSAVDAMSTLIRDYERQKERVRELTEALEVANARLLEQSNALAQRVITVGGYNLTTRNGGMEDTIGFLNPTRVEQLQRLTTGRSGHATSGVGFNHQFINRSSSISLPPRPSTLDGFLMGKTNLTNLQGIEGRSDIRLVPPFQYDHSDAEVLLPSSQASLQHLGLPTTTLNETRDDKRIRQQILMHHQEDNEVSNMKGKRRKYGDSEKC